MSVVDLATAKQDMRVDHDADDALIQRLLNTAERYVVHFLGRNLYATQGELDTAMGGAHAALVAAAEAYQAALDAAAEEENFDIRYLMTNNATESYRRAVMEYERTINGVLVDDLLQTSVTMTTAFLYEHRGDEELPIGVPNAARTYMWTYRRELPI